MADNEFDLSNFTYDETISRMKDVRDDVDRLRKRAGELTDEERSKVRAFTDQFAALTKHKETLEVEARYAAIAQEFDRPHDLGVDDNVRALRVNANAYDVDPFSDTRSLEELKGRNPWNMESFKGGRAPEAEGSEWRARAFDAVQKMRGANDAMREAGTRMIERFDNRHGSLSKVIHGLSDPMYYAAFLKLAADPQRPDFTPAESRAYQNVRSIQRAMSLTDAAGGLLVPFQLDPTLMFLSATRQSGIRSVANTVIATGNKWNGSTSQTPTFSWDGEGVEVSDDAVTIARVDIPIFKASGFIPISLELLADAPNIGAQVAQSLARGRANIEAGALSTGGGVTAPQGLVTGLVAAGAPTVVAAGTDGTLNVADIYALDNALSQGWRDNATWVGNRATFNEIRQLDTNGGASMWTQLGDGRPATLLGYPVVEAEDMDASPETATANNYGLALGDIREAYTIADRIGFTVDFIPHLFAATNRTSGHQRPTGESGWYGYFRMGAEVTIPDAARILNV